MAQRIGEEEMKYVYVLRWWFSDNSAHGIIGVFDNEPEARKIFDVLAVYGGMRQISLDAHQLNEIKDDL